MWIPLSWLFNPFSRGSAEIKHGTLTVQLTGDPVRGWRKDFSAVAALLEQSNGKWGEVTLEKTTIEAADVREGAEEDLRHFLESVVLQVNSDLDLDAGEDGSNSADADAGSDEDTREAAERKMAATFRSFAQPES
jgi:hypothetical protein